MAFEHGAFVLDLAGALLFAGGEVGSVLNPEGVQVIIVETTLWVKTKSAAAANLNVGIASDATTSAANLISTLAVGDATGKAFNGLNPAAKSEQAVWDADEYLTVTGSASTVGLVGKVILKYRHV